MVDYEHFLNQLRQKEAAPLMNHFKSFLARFNSEKRPIMQQRKLVSSFLHYIYGESLQNEIFADASEDAELENIREGWEKLVMMNIYERVFATPESDDVKMGAHLQKRIDSFQWIQEHHLDLPFSFHHTLEVAQAELLRVNGFRAPRDKLIIFQNTSQLVVDLIQKASTDNAGNDHLLPSLILTVIRANPPNLIANIKYIMRFRNQTELDKGPNQYCITNMISAVSFIYNMTPRSLTLSDEEKIKFGIAKELPPRPSEIGESSSQRDAGPQVSQLASKVYTSTSGWFNNLIREAKIFGEQAAGKVDGFVSQVVGDSDDEGEDGRQRPPLPPRQGSEQALNSGAHYPGQIRTDAGGRTLQPNAQGNVPWVMQPSPNVSPMSPMPGMEGAPTPPPRDGGNMTQAEREDYELQLAMALSLSTIEEDKRRRGEVGEDTLQKEETIGGAAADSGEQSTSESLLPVDTSAPGGPAADLTSQNDTSSPIETDVPLVKSDVEKSETPGSATSNNDQQSLI